MSRGEASKVLAEAEDGQVCHPLQRLVVADERAAVMLEGSCDVQRVHGFEIVLSTEANRAQDDRAGQGQDSDCLLYTSPSPRD